MVLTQHQQANIIITLSPNRSATWQQTKWVIAIMVAVVMIIAVAWTFVGAWVVLPFAGLEVGLFALLMYKVSRFTYSQQVIEILPSNVVIAFGYRKKRIQATFEREHVSVFYSETDNHWELPKIRITDTEQSLFIGEFLNLEDRIALKQALEDNGLMVCKNKWWTR
ncbi:MAG: DUF2244 domain-containing protein [Glaciecola sp.]